jgi:hypothetical protein
MMFDLAVFVVVATVMTLAAIYVTPPIRRRFGPVLETLVLFAVAVALWVVLNGRFK